MKFDSRISKKPGRVLEKYNLFAVISKLIKERHTSENASSPTSISSRRALRKNISVALQDAYAKSTSRFRNWLQKIPPMQNLNDNRL